MTGVRFGPTLATVACCAAAVVGCGPPPVVRVVDGQQVDGRFVAAEAYAAYARGALAEADGDDATALQAYSDAARDDDDSAELWSRIGAVRCRQGDGEGAREAFREAEEIDGSYEPLWRERARCAERDGRLDDALQAARRATDLDPDREGTVLLYASLLERRGDQEQAERWLRAASIQRPNSLRTWQAVAAFAKRRGDGPWQRHALDRLASLRQRLGEPPPLGGEPTGDERSPWAGIDEALGRDDLAGARRRLRQAHHDERWLPARAVAVGQAALAAEQARLLLAADPQDTDSRVGLALAEDLLGQRSLASQRMRLPADAATLSSISRWLLGELLLRHVGEEAARLWLGDAVNDGAPGASSADPERVDRAQQALEAQWRDRLRRRLAE